MSLFGSILQSWRRLAVTHLLSLTPWEKSQAIWVSFRPKLCCFVGGAIWAKSSCSSYPLQFSKSYFSPSNRVQLLLWKPGILQRLSCPSMGDCPSQCSPGALDHCREGLELVHRLLQVHSWYWGLLVYYLMHRWVRPWVSWQMVLDPTAPTEAVLFVDEWMPSFCSHGGDKMRNILCCHDSDVTIFLANVLTLTY